MKKHSRSLSLPVRKRELVAPLLALTLLATPALAEEKGGKSDVNSDVYTLGVVEVTGKSDSIKNPSVTTISNEDMLQFDRKTVAEAANLVPGVTISRVGGRNESMVFVRGFDLKHAPLFLDGIPIYVPYDGYPDLGRFFTYDLSELVISKGFASVLYGPNTMGGALNLVSRRPAKTFEGSAGVGYTSGDAYHAFANFGSNQKTWYVQGGGSWVDEHAFDLSNDFNRTKAEDGGTRNNSFQRDWKGSIKLGLTPNSTDEYALNYIYQSGEKGVPPYAGKNTDPKQIKYWQWPYWNKQSVYFNSNTALGDASYVKTRLFYDQFKNSLKIFNDATYSPPIKSGNLSNYNDYSYGASIEAGTTLIPYNALKMAFHYKDDVHREETTASPVQHDEERIFSIAGEDTIQITKKLSALLGVSYDFQNTVQAEDYNPLPGTKAPKVLQEFPRSNNNDVTAQGALFYAYSDTGKVHAAAARKTRYPSIKDKYSYRFGTYIPNADLKPEVSNNYEIGFEDTFAKLVNVKSTFFFNDISDYVQAAAISSTVSQFQNIGRVQRYGYEFEAVAPISDSLETGINYTFIYNKNRTNNQQITDIPKHKFFAYGKYSPIKPLSFFASLEYDTKRFSTSDGIYKAGEFVVINMKISYEVVRDLLLEGGINNLADRNYALTEGYPEAGRSYFIQARYKF
ncbi:MAG: TonB-dependent receptor [Desulfuromonadales bacterium]|nr:TonB-dependent receptor [Desulfuromonadales bacterium]